MMPAKIMLILLAGLVVITIGCGQPEPPSVKKSRTIAAENIELRKELDRRNKELKMLKEQYVEEITAQKKMLQKCLKEKEELKDKSRQNVRDQVKDVLDTVMEENVKLRAENTRLKVQIEELQKQPQ